MEQPKPRRRFIDKLVTAQQVRVVGAVNNLGNGHIELSGRAGRARVVS